MSFDSLFENASRLPTIPKVLQELILSFNDPDTDMGLLAKKVALEPVLTAKVLKVANSARYGSSRNISSVHEASVLLGFPAVRTIVLACGLVDSLQMPAALNKRQFWHRAFSAAGASKWLAQLSGKCEPDTAFTAGMIHSMGGLLMYVVHPENAMKVQELMQKGQSEVSAQETIYGYNHCAAGAELARRWRFPNPICDALAQQHKPLDFSPVSALSTVICLAVQLNDYLDSEEEKSIETSLDPKLLDSLSLCKQQLQEGLETSADFDGGMSSLVEE